MRMLILGRHSLNALPKLKDNILEPEKKSSAKANFVSTMAPHGHAEKYTLEFETGVKNKSSLPESGDFILKIVLPFSSSTPLICCRVFVFWSFGKM